jgi:hypothetical protein
MATVLEDCNTEEQRSVCFLGQKYSLQMMLIQTFILFTLEVFIA